MSRPQALSSPIELVQDDIGSSILFQLSDVVTGEPLDFTAYPNAVVTVYFREKDGVDIVATRTCSMISASAGQFSFSWGTDDLSGDAGRYELEAKIDWLGNGAKVQRTPQVIPFKLFERF